MGCFAKPIIVCFALKDSNLANALYVELIKWTWTFIISSLCAYNALSFETLCRQCLPTLTQNFHRQYLTVNSRTGWNYRDPCIHKELPSYLYAWADQVHKLLLNFADLLFHRPLRTTAPWSSWCSLLRFRSFSSLPSDQSLVQFWAVHCIWLKPELIPVSILMFGNIEMSNRNVKYKCDLSCFGSFHKLVTNESVKTKRNETVIKSGASEYYSLKPSNVCTIKIMITWNIQRDPL